LFDLFCRGFDGASQVETLHFIPPSRPDSGGSFAGQPFGISPFIFATVDPIANLIDDTFAQTVNNETVDPIMHLIDDSIDDFVNYSWLPSLSYLGHFRHS
jgi:hypothetical protein